MLWKKVMPKLSAGRVQSVATRIVVQRERERMQFVTGLVLGHRRHAGRRRGRDAREFGARLSAVDGARLATGRDFGPDGRLKLRRRSTGRWRRPTRGGWPRRWRKSRSEVASVEEKPYTRKPYAPFMTSTLQQEAGRKLRFSADRTMSVAQRLYENGYITYMRTDSTTLSETALTAARAQATELYGRRVRAGPAAPLRPQGEERAGGPRGDPPRRRGVPHPRSRSPRSWPPTSSGSTS